MHLRIPGFVGEVEETGWRGVDDIIDTEPSRVLPPAALTVSVLIVGLSMKLGLSYPTEQCG